MQSSFVKVFPQSLLLAFYYNQMGVFVLQMCSCLLHVSILFIGHNFSSRAHARAIPGSVSGIWEQAHV